MSRKKSKKTAVTREREPLSVLRSRVFGKLRRKAERAANDVTQEVSNIQERAERGVLDLLDALTEDEEQE